MRLAIILGTRPEIIKMAPLIWECQVRQMPFFILHTGQHYTPNMDEQFFKELNIPSPDYNLGLGQLSYRKQVGFFIKNISAVLKKEKPDVVVVQGDTITVVAGALAASKLGIPVAHHEAGLRSHDVTMLEEVNRTITDHVSELLFTPTETATANLIEEGFNPENIFLTGNTVVDVIIKHKNKIKESSIFKELNITEKSYFLVTAHRAENVDNKERLEKILDIFELMLQEFPERKIVLPLHPRTRRRIEEFGLTISEKVLVIEPVGYFTMLALESKACLIITDSGGIQEEACVLQVPAVTIRDNTERPETVNHGFNVLVPGLKPQEVIEKIKEMLVKSHNWSNPFGNGDSGKKILDIINKSFS